MLYTVELDTAPGLVDLRVFDVSAFAEALEKYGALDAVASAGGDGSLGYTAQLDEPWSIVEAVKTAIKIGETAYAGYFPVESVRAYLTPVLEEAQVA